MRYSFQGHVDVELAQRRLDVARCSHNSRVPDTVDPRGPKK